ncbi:hypothetical protein MBLNU459_g5560t1 [Dothideomycetes sp. NU459]
MSAYQGLLNASSSDLGLRGPTEYSHGPETEEHELDDWDRRSSSQTSGPAAFTKPQARVNYAPLSQAGAANDDANADVNNKGREDGARYARATRNSLFLINLGLTLWAKAKYGTRDGGIGTVLVGSCDATAKWSRWLHMAINILSTLLLGASNYCMQRLSAPTRSDLDRAHARGVWLDIGVPSLRNQRWLGSYRSGLWLLLGLSSLPLHLMYNSVVFETLSSPSSYQILVATEKFMAGGTWNLPYRSDAADNAFVQSIQSNLSSSQSQNESSWVRLSKSACVSSYDTGILPTRSDLVVVTSQGTTPANNSVLGLMSSDLTTNYILQSYDPRAWMCAGSNAVGYDSDGGVCNYDDQPGACAEINLVKDSSKWQMCGNAVEYCMSRVFPQHCQLQFSVPILMVVIVCNALKAIAMFWSLRQYRERPLVTVGDAIASFMNEPDGTSRYCGLISAREVRAVPTANFLSAVEATRQNPQPANVERRKWATAASKRRWTTTLTLVFITLLTVVILLGTGANSLAGEGVALTEPAFGAVSAEALVYFGSNDRTDQSLIAMVVLANLPQLVLSGLYLMYNSLYTCMLLGHEWTTFSQSRKSLRVSYPAGKQRSTYFLSLPYAYAIPLLVASALLHWLASQSLFLARVAFYSPSATGQDGQITTVGYSCTAIIAVLVVAVVLLAVVWVTGARTYPANGMPLVSSCSFAISAACHPPAEDTDGGLKPVMWGEVKMGDGSHCSFTSLEVQPLEHGKIYV